MMQSQANKSQPVTAAAELRQQWMQPTDVIPVLLLLGGEIVNKALAQLAGGSLTQVTFSFGIEPPPLPDPLSAPCPSPLPR